MRETSRFLGLTVIGGCVAVSALAFAAPGDDCEADTDCGVGEHCEVYGESGSGREPVLCDPEDADCEATVTEVVVEREAYCEADPVVCDTDADCPEGAACAAAACVYDLTSCASAADCGGGEICIAVEGSSSDCSQEPCSANGDCPEPVCEEASDEDAGGFGVCFPPPVSCSSDADCEGSDVCFSLPDGDGPDEYAGFTDVCWAPGLSAAIDGAITLAVDGERFGASGDAEDSGELSQASGAGDSPGSGAEEVDTANSAPASDDGRDGADESDGDDAAKSDGGCAITGAAPPSGGGLGMALVLGLGLAGLLRRRR